MAADLDMLVKLGQIISWERQFKIDLRVNDVHIANYFCDFRVLYPDNTYELLEAKGIETETFRLKLKLLEAVWLPEHPDHTYRIVKERNYYVGRA